MRIAITGNFGLTGKQTMAARALPLARALAARGHAVHVALPVRAVADRKGPTQVGGVSISHAEGRCLIPGASTAFWQPLILAWHCWRWRPDVLYCFKPIAHSWAALAAFWLVRRLRLFRGILALDCDDWEGNGGWNELQPFPRWLKRLISWQERWSLRHADVVTVASRTLMAMAGEAGAEDVTYLPNAPAVVSPLPSDEQVAALRDRLRLDARPVVLLYTRFFEFGLDRLLDVFERILQGAPDARLLVVGKGFKREEATLGEMAAERGISGSFVFAGWVPRDDLPAFFAAADVALYPMDDTLLNCTKSPVKLLDLLAAGVPVVADRVGQATEYVADGRTGALVDSGDPNAMADALVSLLADGERRARISRAAKEDVRVRWTWEVWAAEAERALARARSIPALRPRGSQRDADLGEGRLLDH